MLAIACQQLFSFDPIDFIAQVVASDVGATITGVTADNQVQFLLELAWAVAKGDLEPPKFPVAVRAAAVTGDQSYVLAEVIG